MALLVNDQKQFVLRMINPAIAAALACGYQSYKLPDAGHLASLSVQAREFLEIGLIHECCANTKSGPHTFRLVLRSVAIQFLASEISVWVERRRAPAHRADAGKSLMEPPLQLVDSRERLF